MAPLQRSNSPIQSTDQLQIQHFTHQHLLHKLHMTFEFKCDACNTAGYGVRYRCSVCDFDLHEQCATSPHRISSHLHPHHQLLLVNLPGDSHFCYVCRGFTNGLSYTCECQTCEFNVHPLCINILVATGVPSLTMDLGKQTGVVQPMTINQQHLLGTPTTSVGDVHPTHPVTIHQYQQQQGIPTMSFDGNNRPSNNQPMMINQQQPQKQYMPIRSFGGYDGVNNNQPMMVNHHHHQQQQQHQPQGLPMTAFGGFHGINSNQHVMMNHSLQQPQQQRIPMTAYNGYQGMKTNQQVMINNHQQQQQGLPTVGYNVVNNNQTVVINQPPPQQYQQQSSGNSSNYSKVGKIAANILSTTLIGVPIFNPRN